MTTVLTTQEPDPADQFNGSGRTLGMVFTVDATTEIVALRFWAVATSPPASVTVGLWNDGTAAWLATEGASGPFAEGWNEVPLAAPVELSPGTTYGVAYWKASGNVPGLAGLHSSPISNGPFTAPTNAGRSRNTNTGPPASAPPVAAGTFSFFADVQSAAATPAEGAAAYGLGLGLAATGRRQSAGVAGYGVGLELAADGARDSAGVGGSTIGLELEAAGSRASAGTAALGLGLELAASGVRPSRGTAAFVLGLALAGPVPALAAGRGPTSVRSTTADSTTRSTSSNTTDRSTTGAVRLR